MPESLTHGSQGFKPAKRLGSDFADSESTWERGRMQQNAAGTGNFKHGAWGVAATAYGGRTGWSTAAMRDGRSGNRAKTGSNPLPLLVSLATRPRPANP